MINFFIESIQLFIIKQNFKQTSYTINGYKYSSQPETVKGQRIFRVNQPPIEKVMWRRVSNKERKFMCTKVVNWLSDRQQ